MVHVGIIKLNGWPETFDERVIEIARNVERVTLIRPRPDRGDTEINQVPNVTVRDVYPSRGKSVNQLWLHPLLFPAHVIQAIIMLLLLSYASEDPPDVIHSLDYILGGIVGAVFTSITQTPFVVSVRGLIEPRYKNMVEQNNEIIGRLNYRLLQLLPGFVFSHADYLITKAEYQEQYVRNQYGLSIPYSTIPTGVDYSVFNPKVVPDSCYPEQLADIGDEQDHTFALFLGRLTEEKGADKILENLNKVSDPPTDLHLLYVGDFRDDMFKKRLRRLAQESTVPVTIHDERIPYKKVPELISNVQCTVLLSGPRHEGVPRVLQEACVLETSIVASDVLGITEAFGGFKGCHLVKRDDPDALNDAFRNVANSNIRPNREEFRCQFDMQRNYAKYAEIYTDVLSK